MDKNYATGWNELKTKNSWMLFKIMGEFVEGFEKMGLHNPCISIFGSARTPNTHPNYKLASEIAQQIVNLGFGVITGGGPGIMEAANKGAQEAGGAHEHFPTFRAQGRMQIEGCRAFVSLTAKSKCPWSG